MTDAQSQAFVELVSSRFGALPEDQVLEAFRAQRGGDADFDLFLWSLAHRSRIDTEELLRRLGERWAADLEEARASAGGATAMELLERVVGDESLLAAAPLPGVESFEVAISYRGERELRARCVGPRRCCSFLEGIARGVAAMRGESLRYARKPEGRRAVELSFRLIGEARPLEA